MATSCPCYNHDDRTAVWRCLDCKPDCVIKFCKECHEIVHCLPVFKLHRTQLIYQGEFKRRLSQDISDLENLVVVEKNILDGVLATLRYTEQQEREMLQDVVKKTEQRLHDIQQCHDKVDKAIMYLSKVSTVITSCSTPGPVAEQDLPQTLTNEQPTEQESQAASTTELPTFPVDVVGSLNKRGCFWLIKKTTVDRLKVAQIDHDLREHFKANPTNIPPSTLKEGGVYVAKSPGNTEFWRIRVEKLCANEMVKVRYLDYGMQEDLPINSIIDIPAIFQLIPYQAMECCLFPLAMPVSLPYEAKWCFKDLTHGKVLAANICSKMVYPQGHSVHHVQLTSAGPPPVNINQKVADLLEQKKLEEEEGPILPNNKAIAQDNKVNQKMENTKAEMVEEKKVEEISSTGGPSFTVVSLETPAQTQEEPQTKPTILKNSPEGVPAPTQKDAPKRSLVGMTSDAAVMAPEYVPIGYVNERMYHSIYSECSANKPTLRGLLPKARYFLTKGNYQQFVEAMKSKVWCCLDERFACAVNNAYKEQAANQNAVLLVFVLPNNFAGLVRIASEMRLPCPHCTIISPGLLWGHSCRAEFNIQLFSVDKFGFQFLENSSYIKIFLRDSAAIGRELRFQKGEEICHRFERLKRAYSVLDNASRLYRKETLVPRDFRSSQENFSEDEEPLSWRRRRDNAKAPETSMAAGNLEPTGSAPNEDWESDLDTLPARVAEIYLNLSHPEEKTIVEGSNAEDTESAQLDDETPVTKEETEALDATGTEDPNEPLQSNVEGDNGREIEKEEAVVDQEHTQENSSHDVSDNTECANKAQPIIEETQPDLPTEPLEPSPKSSEASSTKDETGETTDENHKDTATECPHPDEQALTSEHVDQQEVLPHGEHSRGEASPVQVADSDVNVTKGNRSDIEKEHFPSYMQLGEDLDKDGSANSQPQNVQPLTGKPVSDGVESQQVSKEMFYHVMTPPHTPSCTTTQNESSSSDNRVTNMAEEDTENSDVIVECSSSATEVKKVKNSIASRIAIEGRRTNTGEVQHVHLDDEIADDYDDEQEPFLPVRPGHQYVVQVKIDRYDENTFLARLQRDRQEEGEFWRFSKELSDWAKSSDKLSHVYLLKYCCLLNSKGNYVRALITKVNRDDKVVVRFIDYTTSAAVPVDDLRELHERFVINMPPQAFECRFVNQDVFEEKTRDLYKKHVLADIVVKAIQGEIADVEFLGLRQMSYPPKQRKNQFIP